MGMGTFLKRLDCGNRGYGVRESEIFEFQPEIPSDLTLEAGSGICLDENKRTAQRFHGSYSFVISPLAVYVSMLAAQRLVSVFRR